MFCRFCGAHILEDSQFCAKCGKRLSGPRYPALERLIQRLWLKTPYPYFGTLILAFGVWAVMPRQTRGDYSSVIWSMEMDRKLDDKNDGLYRQSLSLVLENKGASAVKDIPIELSAQMEPRGKSEILAEFMGRKLLIWKDGKPLPLVVVLSDTVNPGQKRKYFFEGTVYATGPFKVTYEVREEDRTPVLTSYTYDAP